MGVFGWDISTSCIGACFMQDGDVKLIRAIRLDKIEDKLQKYLVAAEEVRSFIHDVGEKYGNDHQHCIEQRLKNMVGKTNKDTLLALASMNAVVTFVIMEECKSHTQIEHLYPVEVKKLVGLKVPKGADKKEAAITFAREKWPDFPYELNRKGVNPIKGTDDMADAFITAYAWTVKHADKGKEADPPEGGTRPPRVRKARKI